MTLVFTGFSRSLSLNTGDFMQRLYCYVDESGQHSQGAYFLVSVVIAGDDRDKIEKWLLATEKAAGKNRRKWTHAGDANRVAYIQAVLNNPDLKGRLFSAYYRSGQDYVRLTIETTARAMQAYTAGAYKATIVVDGLQKSERNRFAVGLRSRGILTYKVVGRDDQQDAFIRLADALCGFVADALAGREDFKRLLDKAERQGMVQRVEG
jgi:hypothetical protein